MEGKYEKVSDFMGICFCFIKPFNGSRESEKSLLASAIKIYASIDPDIDIKTRIKSTELVIKKIDEVLENHADTDIGLEMLISDKFGKYSISELRSKYLNDVISYNLKVAVRPQL